MKINFYNLLVVFLAVMANGAFGANCQLRVWPGVCLPAGQAVTLGDIAEVKTDDAVLKGRLDGLVISKPGGEVKQRFGVFEISRCLVRAGVNPVSVDIYGAVNCCVSVEVADAETLPAVAKKDTVPMPMPTDPPIVKAERFTLADQLAREVVKVLTGLDGDRLIMSWECNSEPGILQEPATDGRFMIKPYSQVDLGQVKFRVYDKADPDNNNKAGRNKKKWIRINGEIKYFCESVVARRLLRSGDVIGADDVKFLPRPITNLSKRGIEDMDVVVGQEVARNVKPGKLIELSMIKKLRLVKRNDMVRVQAKARGIEITLMGKAMSDGTYGETIGVKDQRTKTVLYGKVIGAGIVTVSPK